MEWHFSAADRMEQVKLGIKDFTPFIRQRLFEIMCGADYRGIISTADVLDIKRHGGMDYDQFLLQLIDVARVFAKAPISDFHVGVVVEGESQALYLGTNLEFNSEPLNQTIHAEQSAVMLALGHEKSLRRLVVSASPCGHCRQFLYELGLHDLRIQTPAFAHRTLREILPDAFGPEDLGVTTTPFLEERQQKMDTGASDPRFIGSRDVEEEAVRVALGEALRSHAPYSAAYAGCAIVTKAGRIFKGRYVENAAFNPSVGPIHGALIGLNIAGVSVLEIARVVLVERQGALVHHEGFGKALLGAVCGREVGIHLRTFEVAS